MDPIRDREQYHAAFHELIALAGTTIEEIETARKAEPF